MIFYVFLFRFRQISDQNHFENGCQNERKIKRHFWRQILYHFVAKSDPPKKWLFWGLNDPRKGVEKGLKIFGAVFLTPKTLFWPSKTCFFEHLL